MSGMKRRRGTFSFSPSLWHGSLVLCAELSLLRELNSAENQLNSTKADKASGAFGGTARARVGKPAQAQVESLLSRLSSKKLTGI